MRPDDHAEWAVERDDMLRVLRRHGIRDERVLAAMRTVPRHRFIPPGHLDADAYGDFPRPIGFGQTISQPYIVAHMTERLDVRPGMRVLEVGTGCGYQAAVLAALGATVYSVERLAALSALARLALDDCGFGQVRLRVGDGYEGWPEAAPFDRILAACAPPVIPDVLCGQLRCGGRMILPVGVDPQRLAIVVREPASLQVTDDLWVRFVPMLHGCQASARDTGA